MKTKHHNRYLKKVLSKLGRDDPKTKEVVLNGFPIGKEDERMAQLAMSLVSNTHIKVLCLNSCGITSKGAHLMAYALGKNRSLEHVRLNENKIGSSGADAIATAMMTNQTLLTLGLSNNSIGNHGGKALVRAMRQNYSITDIFVEGNRMNDRLEDEINKTGYGAINDEEDDEIQEYRFNCNHDHTHAMDDFDAGTVTGSVVSKSFVHKTLDAIKEVDYESDSYGESDDDESLASSSPSEDEPMDLDFECFYQKKKQSKLAKLKAVTRMMRRKKVKPSVQCTKSKEEI